MNQSKYAFTQLTALLDRNKFNRIVTKYSDDRYVKHFTCWNQLLVMMFGQLSNRESLRDLIISIDAHNTKSYHLGFGKNVSKTSLARANQTRDYHIFEEYAYFLVEKAQKRHQNDIFKLDGKVYAFDSTTISLCLDVFWWAKFRKDKGGVKIHTLYDIETQIPTFFHITTASVHDAIAMKEIPYEVGAYYIFDRGYNNFKALYHINQIESYFVVRAKSNLQYKSTKIRENTSKNIFLDTDIEFTVYRSRKDYPENMRLIKFYDEEQEREFVFLTNATHLTAEQVADLYKSRWQIELFFKWLKQHLKIKKFWGITENAVRIQIYTAICTYCLVAIMQQQMQLNKRSTYEVLQILGISLIDKTPIKDLFNKTTLKDDKEHIEAYLPTLF